MKINTKLITDFLTEVRMSEADECLLEFKEDGLYVNVNSSGKTHSARGFFSKTGFDKYSPIGNLGVNELGNIIKVFKRLGKTIEFDVEGNLFLVKGDTKKLEFELVDEKFIEPAEKIPELTHATNFKVDAQILSEFLSDAAMNKESATNKGVVFKLETVENGVKLSNTGKYKFTRNIESAGTKAGYHARFGEPFREVLTSIKNGIVELNISTDYPLSIKVKNDFYTIDFLVAPRIDKD